MRKRLLAACVLLTLWGPAASAASVLDATRQVLDRLDIAPQKDVGILKSYKNWRAIPEADGPVLAAAVGAGVLAPQNGVLEPNSGDLTAVREGLAYYGLSQKGYQIVAGPYQNDKIAHGIVSGQSLAIDGPLVPGTVYTALADNNNQVVAAWLPTDMVWPALMRAKLYVVQGKRAIVTSLERYYGQDDWRSVGDGGFQEIALKDGVRFQSGAVPLTEEDVNTSYLDAPVYLVADCYTQVPSVRLMEVGG